MEKEGGRLLPFRIYCIDVLAGSFCDRVTAKIVGKLILANVAVQFLSHLG